MSVDAAILEHIFDNCSDGAILAVVEDALRQESMQVARKLAAIAQLLRRRIDEELAIDADARSMITGFARTTAEVAALINMSTAAARAMVFAAETLDQRLPAVGELLARGEVSWPTVELVIKRTELVADDLMPQIDPDMAERLGSWSSWSRRRVIDAVDHVVSTVDRDGVKKRRQRAYDERGAYVSSDGDGMATLRIKLSAPAGKMVDAELSAMAASVCPADPRSLQQRRADAFEALAERRGLECRCGASDCPKNDPATGQPSASSTQVSPKVVLNVVAGADTVNGQSQAPGYLVGFGVIDAELVRELARDATRRLVEEPVVSQHEALRYRPGAALARWIRLRDLTCRAPGCSVPAEQCDIDHITPFNHRDPAAGGHTVPWNLACFCRQHHRCKTFGGWCVELLADGTIVWTSPTGAVSRTTPGSTGLFGMTVRPRRREDRTRVERARARLCAHRATTEYNRYRNQAATREIRDRRWRNDTRRWRGLFHGPISDKPSNAPYMQWVNDPLEPEELQPHWQPPPRTPSDPDEPPPF
ncbi:HNH endonuclease signature motif containing protein [Mycolicibacterium psychrotolerans]|uniref:HNH nuclease domain-containing protein n=1 Tax=Mycolicibacterium psychrotolerans TaxID=216929 RepID=A0A7I7M4P4_9MYCO|nr:HNH endonuclease signature motif containing protein [Mycolicibacterium psychrotolerans]BBX66886.1 hypothetical protein MPSYJ_03470 [Mycolicibacterium psychrotolerans]